MRHLLAAVAVLALAGSVDAQQPAQTRNPVAGGYFTTNAAYSDPFRNNAAGSIYSDYAFAFGSTRSFFAPCGPLVGPTCSECWAARRKPKCPPAPPCDK